MPAKQNAGTKIATPVELTDIMPTLCDVANIKTPSNAEGESLLPLFFNPEAETEYDNDGDATTSETKKVSSEDSIVNANSSDPYLGYHQMGKAMAEHYSNNPPTENNAVAAPVIPTTSVYNRTTDNLNNQLTSMKDHVNMLNNNLTEAKKKDLELYKEQISLIEAELDAREKKKSQELREKLKHYAQ